MYRNVVLPKAAFVEKCLLATALRGVWKAKPGRKCLVKIDTATTVVMMA
jgi:hypothetical protein